MPEPWKKLKELRAENKLTQNDVANAAGVSGATISSWEVHAPCWLDQVANIARALHTTPNVLFGFPDPVKERVVNVFSEDQIDAIYALLKERNRYLRNLLSKDVGKVDQSIVDEINANYSVIDTIETLLD